MYLNKKHKKISMEIFNHEILASEDRSRSHLNDDPEIIIPISSTINNQENRNSSPFMQNLPPIFLADQKFVFRISATSFFTQIELEKLTKTGTLSRKICWLALIDCILISFILYFGIYYLLLILIVLPIFGFIASRRFSYIFSIIFLIYLLLVVGLRIALLCIQPSIPIIVIQGLIISLELYISYLDILFSAFIKKLTTMEKEYLLGRMPLDSNEQQIPDNVSVQVLESPPVLYEISSIHYMNN